MKPFSFFDKLHLPNDGNSNIGMDWSLYVNKHGEYTYPSAMALVEKHLNNEQKPLNTDTFNNFLDILIHTNFHSKPNKDENSKYNSGFMLRDLFEHSSKSEEVIKRINTALAKYFNTNHEISFISRIENDYSILDLFYPTDKPNLIKLLSFELQQTKNVSNNYQLQYLTPYILSLNLLSDLKLSANFKSEINRNAFSYLTMLNIANRDIDLFMSLIPENQRVESLVVLFEYMDIIETEMKAEFKNYRVILEKALCSESSDIYSKYKTLRSLDIKLAAEELLFDITDETVQLPELYLK